MKPAFLVVVLGAVIDGRVVRADEPPAAVNQEESAPARKQRVQADTGVAAPAERATATPSIDQMVRLWLSRNESHERMALSPSGSRTDPRQNAYAKK